MHAEHDLGISFACLIWRRASIPFFLWLAVILLGASSCGKAIDDSTAPSHGTALQKIKTGLPRQQDLN